MPPVCRNESKAPVVREWGSTIVRRPRQPPVIVGVFFRCLIFGSDFPIEPDSFRHPFSGPSSKQSRATINVHRSVLARKQTVIPLAYSYGQTIRSSLRRRSGLFCHIPLDRLRFFIWGRDQSCDNLVSGKETANIAEHSCKFTASLLIHIPMTALLRETASGLLEACHLCGPESQHPSRRSMRSLQ
jgi:hypothetical protein